MKIIIEVDTKNNFLRVNKAWGLFDILTFSKPVHGEEASILKMIAVERMKK